MTDNRPAYVPPPPTLWERFMFWRPIWSIRWRAHNFRISAGNAWEDRAEILASFRRRLVGEEQFASKALIYGDSYESCMQRHQILIATGLWGWEPTGIEYEWRAAREPGGDVIGDGVMTYFYAGLTFSTFDAAQQRWRDDQQQ